MAKGKSEETISITSKNLQPPSYLAAAGYYNNVHYFSLFTGSEQIEIMNKLKKILQLLSDVLLGLNIICPLTRFISFKYRKCSILATNKIYCWPIEVAKSVRLIQLSY